jgi:sugar lactone lactonase YvrE
MRRRLRDATAAATLVWTVLSLAACGGGSLPASPARVLGQFRSADSGQSYAAKTCLTVDCIYATNYATFSVTAYPAREGGNIAPLQTIRGPATGLHAPTGVAIDANRSIYVANSGMGSPPHASSVTVYAGGTSGNVAPLRTIIGPSTRLGIPIGIVLDDSGNIYVANSLNNRVNVYAAGANGDAAPIRSIAGSNTGLKFPAGIALDAAHKVYVTNQKRHNFSVTVYAPDAQGNVAPVQTISGPNTGLSFPYAVAIDANGNIYVTNSRFGPGSVTVFAAGASGNADPIQTIKGPNTGLYYPSGIALEASGTIYLGNGCACNNTSSIEIFTNGARGNAKPARVISGSTTKLESPAGIAIR